MPRRNSKTRPSERGHTISGKRIRVRPTPSMIRWLERDEKRLQGIIRRGANRGRQVEGQYVGSPTWIWDRQTDLLRSVNGSGGHRGRKKRLTKKQKHKNKMRVTN